MARYRYYYYRWSHHIFRRLVYYSMRLLRSFVLLRVLLLP